MIPRFEVEEDERQANGFLQQMIHVTLVTETAWERSLPAVQGVHPDIAVVSKISKYHMQYIL